MKANILLIEQFLPFPLNNGGAQAIFNGILALKEKYQVFLFFVQDVPEDDLKKFHAAIGQDVVILPQPPKPQSSPLKLLNRLALSFYYRTHSDKVGLIPFADRASEHIFPNYILEYVNTLIKRYAIKVVQVEMAWLMSLVLCLPKGVKKVYVHHELRFVRNSLEVQAVGTNLFRQSAIAVNKILEIGLLNQYDTVITLSEIDKKKLIEAGVKVPICSSFAIVNTNNTISKVESKSHFLSFIGPEFHVPNKVGIMWFLENCWNQLLATNSDMKLKIIGKWDEETKRELSKRYKNLCFTGFVDDLAIELCGSIMIVPITIGSGIRMKILEAASMGIPVVSTTVGAEGLPLKSGENCFLADEPKDFVDSIIKLNNQNLCKQFVESLNQEIKAHYSLEALRHNRTKIFDKLLNDELS